MSAPTVDRLTEDLAVTQAALDRMTVRAHNAEQRLAEAAVTNRRLRRLVQLLIDYAGGSARPTRVDGPGDVW